VERLRGNHSLSTALTGVTAAVVGVIANLAAYFAVHILFATTHAWRWGRCGWSCLSRPACGRSPWPSLSLPWC
jgi:hypothetical protein